MIYFQVFGVRSTLYQWDVNRRVAVNCDCQEVHFSNSLDGEALVVETYTEDGALYANIPNILLQSALPLNVYAYVCGDEQRTERAVVIEVNPRSKPADYVYTETEVKNYEALAARIKALEENGGGGGTAGNDGITPHIGENGNWYTGETDTGVQAQGPAGPAGSDYILTEADKTEIAEEAAALVDAALLNLIGEVE